MMVRCPDRFDDFIDAKNLVFPVFGAAEEAQTMMVKGVVADGVALIVNTPEQVGVLLGVTADDKERGADV